MRLEQDDTIQGALSVVGRNYLNNVKHRLPNPDEQSQIIIEETKKALDEMALLISQGFQALCEE